MIKNLNNARQAITTKYCGPGNVRGSRIIATAEAGRIIVDYDPALNMEENCAIAAEKLANKYGWLDRMDMIIGGTASGYVFVLSEKEGV